MLVDFELEVLSRAFSAEIRPVRALEDHDEILEYCKKVGCISRDRFWLGILIIEELKNLLSPTEVLYNSRFAIDNGVDSSGDCTLG